jgi:membrane fusion protein (multidrug efflux system)
MVFIVHQDENGDLISKPVVVSVGETRDGRIAILSGLEPNTRIVTAGQNKLYRGAKIVIDEAVDM